MATKFIFFLGLLVFTSASAQMIPFANWKKNVITLYVTSSVQNYNVATAANNPTSSVKIVVTINSSVTISSNNAGVPAFTTGSLPAGSTVTINNNGLIAGAGGNGGAGGAPGLPGSTGQTGGTALNLTVDTVLNNAGSGIIRGGGGGGGGGGATNLFAGGGGGGGAGVLPGTGGNSGATPGSAATVSTAGAGGPGVSGSGLGGVGGLFGSVGTAGSSGNFAGGGGGLPGYSYVKNSHTLTINNSGSIGSPSAP